MTKRSISDDQSVVPATLRDKACGIIDQVADVAAVLQNIVGLKGPETTEAPPSEGTLYELERALMQIETGLHVVRELVGEIVRVL